MAERTALLVDDDPRVRRVVAAYLESMGFGVVQASDGRSAIARLDDARPALLCLDLVLPESSGYEVCRHVRRNDRLKDLPILVISARTLPADQAQAHELGVYEYLVKPFTKAAFVAGVERALAGEAHAESP